MTPSEVKQRIAQLHLEELVAEGPLRWFYISTATETEFTGGFFIRAQGPTDALRILHNIGLFPKGSSSQTTEADEEIFERKVPKSFRFRKLTKEEVISIR